MSDAPKLPSSEDFFAQSQRVLNVLLKDALKGDSIEHLCDLASSLSTTSGMLAQQELILKATKEARDFMGSMPTLPPVGGNYN